MGEIISFLAHIIRKLNRVLSNQEQIMADLAAVEAAVAAETTAIDALAAKLASPPPFVLQSDLDPVVESVNANRAKVEAMTAAAP
jgi:hypothetical protein